MESTVIERVSKIIDKYNLSKRAFANKIGMEQTTVNNQLIGKRGVSFDLIYNISKSLPEISIDWLLNGIGEMEKVSLEIITKPRIPMAASAGKLTEALQGVTMEQCEQIPVIRSLPTYDFTILVKGNSMEPTYYSGDEVACKRINEKSFIQWGKVHVLDTTQGVVIKRIYDADKGIRCNSFNSEYPDFIVPKDEIYSMSLVVGLLRL